jgi:hypothetical protein
MKKLAILTLVATLGGLSALAQGTIQFQNSSSFPVKIATGTDAGSLASAFTIGSTQAAALGAGPGQVNINMFVALASAPSTFFLAGSTTNSGSTSALFLGTFHGGSPYSIPASIDGGAFTQGTVIDYYFTATTATGAVGTSSIGTGYALSGGASSPGATFGSGAGQIGAGGFTLVSSVPEPSIMALSGLGAAALLLYRRKK